MCRFACEKPAARSGHRSQLRAAESVTGHGTNSNPSANTMSSGAVGAGTSVATSYDSGVPACAMCIVTEPATGAEVDVIEYEYIVPQSSVPPSGAVQTT